MRALLIVLCAALCACEDKAYEPFRESHIRFRAVRQSLYNQIVIERDGDIVEMRFRTGRAAGRQTAVDLNDPGHLVIPYTRAMLAAALVQPAPKRILQIGLGGGGLNRYLRLAYPDARLTTAELDAAVRDMAVEYMGFRPDELDAVAIEDGRAFVRRSKDTWDWIFVDAFRDGVVPPHLKTKEFYTLLKDHLAPGGVVALNIHRGNRLFQSDQATLRAVFREVHLFDVPGTGNVVVLAFEGPAQGFPRAGLSRLAPDAPASLQTHLAEAAGNYEGPAPDSRAAVLTDDYAPAEFLQQQAER